MEGLPIDYCFFLIVLENSRLIGRKIIHIETQAGSQISYIFMNPEFAEN